MIYTVDLTKHNFNKIDFSESTIVDFECQRELKSSMEFTLWGATLLTSSRWNHNEKYDETIFLNSDDMYISGIGKLKIDGLVGGKITAGIYETKIDSKGRINFVKNSDGSKVDNTRIWPLKKNCNFDSYLWECSIEWPFAGCVLELYSESGHVAFEFDTSNMISADTYVRNPKSYAYPLPFSEVY